MDIILSEKSKAGLCDRGHISVRCLPHKLEDLSSVPSNHIKKAHVCSPCAEETEIPGVLGGREREKSDTERETDRQRHREA